MKRYALDKTVARMFPKHTGAWVKFADVSLALTLARRVIVSDRHILSETYNMDSATGKVEDADEIEWLAQHDEALAAIGSTKP